MLDKIATFFSVISSPINWNEINAQNPADVPNNIKKRINLSLRMMDNDERLDHIDFVADYAPELLIEMAQNYGQGIDAFALLTEKPVRANPAILPIIARNFSDWSFSGGLNTTTLPLCPPNILDEVFNSNKFTLGHVLQHVPLNEIDPNVLQTHMPIILKHVTNLNDDITTSNFISALAKVPDYLTNDNIWAVIENFTKNASAQIFTRSKIETILPLLSAHSHKQAIIIDAILNRTPNSATNPLLTDNVFSAALVHNHPIIAEHFLQASPQTNTNNALIFIRHVLDNPALHTPEILKLITRNTHKDIVDFYAKNANFTTPTLQNTAFDIANSPVKSARNILARRMDKKIAAAHPLALNQLINEQAINARLILANHFTSVLAREYPGHLQSLVTAPYKKVQEAVANKADLHFMALNNPDIFELLLNSPYPRVQIAMAKRTDANLVAAYPEIIDGLYKHTGARAIIRGKISQIRARHDNFILDAWHTASMRITKPEPKTTPHKAKAPKAKAPKAGRQSPQRQKSPANRPA